MTNQTAADVTAKKIADDILNNPFMTNDLAALMLQKSSAKKDAENEQLKQQLAEAQAIIRQCLAGATDSNSSTQEMGSAVFETPLEDAGEYVQDRFAEMEIKLAEAEATEDKDAN